MYMSQYKPRPPPPALHGQGVAVDGGGVRLAGAARGSVAVGDGLVVALGAAGRGLHQVGGVGGGDGGQRDLWGGGDMWSTHHALFTLRLLVGANNNNNNIIAEYYNV